LWRSAIRGDPVIGASEYAAFINHRVKASTATSMLYFDREAEAFEVDSLGNGIRKYHCMFCTDDLTKAEKMQRTFTI